MGITRSTLDMSKPDVVQKPGIVTGFSVAEDDPEPEPNVSHLDRVIGAMDIMIDALMCRRQTDQTHRAVQVGQHARAILSAEILLAATDPKEPTTAASQDEILMDRTFSALPNGFGQHDPR